MDYTTKVYLYYIYDNETTELKCRIKKNNNDVITLI